MYRPLRFCAFRAVSPSASASPWSWVSGLARELPLNDCFRTAKEEEKWEAARLGAAISFPVTTFLVVDRERCCFPIAGGSGRQGWSSR